MKIHAVRGNILDIEADTLVLPVDGSAPGLEGSVARQFMKRVGVEEMYELYAPPPHYPFNGSCYWSSSVPPGKVHFKHICVLGMLSHEQGVNHEGYIASAFGAMFQHAGCDPDYGEVIASPVLRGGTRMNYVDAVYLMLKVYHENYHRHSSVTLLVVENDEDRFEMLTSIIEP
tara:strand:+ start:89 stop:607 length:519 start_codon:yes stop_codon:yes gene_type:complete